MLFFIGLLCMSRKKQPFSANQKPFFCTNLFYCHPKQSFSTLHLPFQPPLTYCLQRMRLFFWCSLNSLRCKAGASHRFKSLPAIPDEVAAFRKTGYLMMAAYFSENHVSTGDLNRGRRTESRVLFGYFLHDAKSNNPYSLVGSFEVFQTSNQRTAMAASHRNN